MVPLANPKHDLLVVGILLTMPVSLTSLTNFYFNHFFSTQKEMLVPALLFFFN